MVRLNMARNWNSNQLINNLNKYFLRAMGVVLFFSYTGCGSSGVSISVLPSTEEFQQYTNADVKIDILFVIDDSGSMSPEQQDLYNNFKNFIELFYDKGFDFRVAVAKTSAFGNTVRCKLITGGSQLNCSQTQYNTGDYIATETQFTPKEFRCGKGNNCGLNSEHQTEISLAGTSEEDEEGLITTLKTTIGNGTPAPGTDHILDSNTLTKNDMIAKFKKNIVVGIAGTGDERGIESAETVIRNMKQFYPSVNDQFPRPNSHLAIIHVGDEGDGPIPNTAGDLLHGSNRNGNGYSSTWGSLRSATINNNLDFNSGYDPIYLVSNSSKNLVEHLDSVESYFDALKDHDPTPLPDSKFTVSVHAIQDLPNSANLASFLPASAYDGCGSTTNNSENNIGYFQSYMAQLSGGLVLSKCNNFGPSLSLLGDTISSLASFFTLSETLDQQGQDTLQVYVEGVNNNNPLPKSTTNGYQYDPVTSRITFYGSMIPPQGAIIGTMYTCATLDCQP